MRDSAPFDMTDDVSAAAPATAAGAKKAAKRKDSGVSRTKKAIIGWEEWVALPELGLPAVKAKSDTGALTASLHAFNIMPFDRDGKKYVRFDVHPVQRNIKIVRTCEAPVVDRRFVTSSNGEKERRYAILTKFEIGGRSFDAEITLTSRHKMTFRMLLGSETLRTGRFIVDPAKSHIFGKIRNAESLYTDASKE